MLLTPFRFASCEVEIRSPGGGGAAAAGGSASGSAAPFSSPDTAEKARFAGDSGTAAAAADAS